LKKYSALVAELLQKLELTMKKRIDPRMHSTEHVLNQTMDRMFNCGRCFNAHIEMKKSKCDYRFDRPLSLTEVQEIQTQVNQIIEADLPVTERYLSRSEAMANYNTDKLPRDTGDTIRIVQIGDYDACPCIGPHVSSSSEISGFQITSTSFDKGVLRIRFKLLPISDS
jgi:Ser-tRNA(Ala) deacylase AlaX